MTNNIQFSSVCGIDIAKSVMQVYRVTSDGVVSNKAVKRADFLNEFRNIPPALIGMEACGGSQHWHVSCKVLVTRFVLCRQSW